MKSWEELQIGQTTYLRRPLAVTSESIKPDYTPRYQKSTVVEHAADHIILQMRGGRLDGEIVHMTLAEFSPQELLSREEFLRALQRGRSYLEHASKQRRHLRAVGCLTLLAAACTVTQLCISATESARHKRRRRKR